VNIFFIFNIFYNIVLFDKNDIFIIYFCYLKFGLITNQRLYPILG